MIGNKNTEAGISHSGIDTKTAIFTASETMKLSMFDSTMAPVEATANVAGMLGTGKIIRCYKCFSCDGYFTASRMTSALVLCRTCLRQARSKGRLARQNQIDRVINKIRGFIRGRMEA